MSYVLQISNALDHEQENISYLAYFPLEKLEKKLQAVRNQLDIAQKKNLTGALELLKLWEQQLLDAKTLKKDLQVEDNDKLDIQFSLPEVEEFEMIERRQEILRQKLLKDSKTHTHSEKEV